MFLLYEKGKRFIIEFRQNQFLFCMILKLNAFTFFPKPRNLWSSELFILVRAKTLNSYIQPLDSRNLRIPAGLYLSSIQLIVKEDTMMKEEQIFFVWYIAYKVLQEESVTQWSFITILVSWNETWDKLTLCLHIV